MKKISFIFFAISTLLFSCGETVNSASDNTKVEVKVEDWVNILTADYEVAAKDAKFLVSLQETEINAKELTKKSDEIIKEMNVLISKTNSYNISGINAKKLSKVAENHKTKNNIFFTSIINYANIVKENTDLLLKKDFNEDESLKFEETILPIADKVLYASDAAHKAKSDFIEAKESL